MFFPLMPSDNALLTCDITFANVNMPGTHDYGPIRATPGGNWVCTAGDGNHAFSSDGGDTWQSATITGLTTGVSCLATDGNGTWAGFPFGDLSGRGNYSTDDGETWGQWSTYTNLKIFPNGMSYANGYFVGVSSGSGFGPVIYSNAGTPGTWFENNSGTISGCTCLSYGNGIWVALGGTGGATNAYMTATDPTGTWTARTLPSTKTWTFVQWNGRVFFAGAREGDILRSQDGISWSAITNPGIITSRAAYSTTGIAGNVLLCSDDLANAAYCTRDDGDSWNLISMPGFGALHGRQGIGTDGTRFGVVDSQNNNKIQMSAV